MFKSNIHPNSSKISVIVPCYNTEKYIKDCLNSIIGQTYKNLEIILVDDGSTDGTGDIIDDYSRLDNRIKVVHQVNKGLSAARNIGIELSTGDYITFVDSDDIIHQKTYSYLMYLLKKYNADCSVGRTRDVYIFDNKIKAGPKIILQDQVLTSTEAIKMVLVGGSGAVNKLFNKDLFKSLIFPVGKTNEDEGVMLKIYSRCTRVALGGRQTYQYRKRANSITTSKFSVKNLDFYFNTLDNIDFILAERPELLEYAYARHYNAAVYCSAKLHFNLLGSSGTAYRKLIKKDLKENRKQMLANKYLDSKFKIVGLICSIF